MCKVATVGRVLIPPPFLREGVRGWVSSYNYALDISNESQSGPEALRSRRSACGGVRVSITNIGTTGYCFE